MIYLIRQLLAFSFFFTALVFIVRAFFAETLIFSLAELSLALMFLVFSLIIQPEED